MRRTLVALAVVALIFAIALPVSAADQIKLKVFTQYSSAEEVGCADYAVAAVKKAYPNVDLEIVLQPQDNDQKLYLLAATGDLPDIVHINLTNIEFLKKSGNLEILDKYQSTADFKKLLMPSTVKLLVQSDGHTYLYPNVGNDTCLLYINKAVFKKYNVKVPTTYAEMLTAIKTFRSNGIIPLSIFAKEGWIGTMLFDILLTRLDPEGFVKVDAGKADASSPAYKTVAQAMIDFAKAGMFSESAITTAYDQAEALFHEGKAAMFINGEWQIGNSTKALGADLDYMYPPAPDAATYAKTIYNFSGGGSPLGFGVSAKSQNKDLAIKIAALFSQKAAEGRYLKFNPIVSIAMNVPPEKPFDPTMARLLADTGKIKSVTLFPWGYTNQKVVTGVADICQGLIAGTITSADDAVKQLGAVIADAKKK